MTFAETLKKIREEKGLTQRDVAERLGVSIQNYNQYETGKRNPKLDTKERIATALGVGLFELETYGEDIPDGSAVIWDKDGDAIIDTANNAPASTVGSIIARMVESIADKKLDNNINFVAYASGYRSAMELFIHKFTFEDVAEYTRTISVFFQYINEKDRENLFRYCMNLFFSRIASNHSDHPED